MSYTATNSQQNGLHAALAAIEIFRAKCLLAAHLQELLKAAEELDNVVDPRDDFAVEQCAALVQGLTALIPTETEQRIVSHAGFALDAQVPLAMAVGALG